MTHAHKSELHPHPSKHKALASSGFSHASEVRPLFTAAFMFSTGGVLLDHVTET